MHIIKTRALEAGAKLVGIRQVISKEERLLNATEDELSGKNSWSYAIAG
jgi:hypothetical protein